MISSLVDEAIAFAARAHAGQLRKVDNTPYIAHPLAVAMILQAMGCGETVVAAALLHDVVEDCDISLEEIRLAFGDEVAGLVAGCTELPKPANSWEVRKLHHIDALQHAPLDVKLITAADKYHNLHHTMRGRPVSDPVTWERFSRGAEQQAWYFRSIAASIVMNVAEPEQYPIFEQLRELVGRVFEGIASKGPTE